MFRNVKLTSTLLGKVPKDRLDAKEQRKYNSDLTWVLITFHRITPMATNKLNSTLYSVANKLTFRPRIRARVQVPCIRPCTHPRSPFLH
jgi:hypothetical protein